MIDSTKISERLTAVEADVVAALRTRKPDSVAHADSGWTVKDVIAHVTAWNWQMLLSCLAALKGGEYRLAPFLSEQQNWVFYRAALAQPWPAVRAEWLASHASARQLMEKLTPAQWALVVMAPWGSTLSMAELIDDISGHTESHLREILHASP